MGHSRLDASSDDPCRCLEQWRVSRTKQQTHVLVELTNHAASYAQETVLLVLL